MDQASEFFGMDFSAKKVEVAPPPPAPAKEKPKAVSMASAMDFFGLDFGAKLERTPYKPKKQQQPTTDGNWEAINSQYNAGQKERDAGQLDILKLELSKEKDPKNIAALQREIERAEKRKKNAS